MRDFGYRDKQTPARIALTVYRLTVNSVIEIPGIFTIDSDKRHSTQVDTPLFVLVADTVTPFIGISKYLMRKSAEKETKTIQGIVMSAIDKYHTATGSYPAGSSDDCVSLMDTLKGNGDSQQVLKKIPKENWDGSSKPLKDGYGENMRYRPTGALGGGPLLWSRGGDRLWDTEDDIYGAER